jgi:hypothetical protein
MARAYRLVIPEPVRPEKHELAEAETSQSIETQEIITPINDLPFIDQDTPRRTPPPHKETLAGTGFVEATHPIAADNSSLTLQALLNI